MEHSGLSFETLKTQGAHCRGLDVVPLVRVPRGEYHFIARAREYMAHGFRLFAYGLDPGMLQNALHEGLEILRHSTGAPA
jgi:2-keto-3-deoxy-L-rhamnonate aldolase RhmA